jgi:hypothetical protein
LGKWSRIIPLVVVSLTALVYAGVDDETIFRDSFENHAPVITSSPITAAGLNFPYSYDVEATDPEGDSLLYLLTTSPAGMDIDPVSGLITWTPDTLGDFPVEVDVSDGNLGSAQQAWAILVSEALDSDGDGLTDEQEETLGTDPFDPDSDDDGVFDGDEVNVHDTNPLVPDSDTDGFLDGSELAVGTDPLNPDDFPDVPPDPEETAPEPDPSIASNVLDATAFLYTGDDPIQTGVTPDTIDLKRAALLRGKVSTRLGAPLPGVTVTVLGHEEFGNTITRADGMFDLAGRIPALPAYGGCVLAGVYDCARSRADPTRPRRDPDRPRSAGGHESRPRQHGHRRRRRSPGHHPVPGRAQRRTGYAGWQQPAHQQPGCARHRIHGRR